MARPFAPHGAQSAPTQQPGRCGGPGAHRQHTSMAGPWAAGRAHAARSGGRSGLMQEWGAVLCSQRGFCLHQPQLEAARTGRPRRRSSLAAGRLPYPRLRSFRREARHSQRAPPAAVTQPPHPLIVQPSRDHNLTAVCRRVCHSPCQLPCNTACPVTLALTRWAWAATPRASSGLPSRSACTLAGPCLQSQASSRRCTWGRHVWLVVPWRCRHTCTATATAAPTPAAISHPHQRSQTDPRPPQTPPPRVPPPCVPPHARHAGDRAPRRLLVRRAHQGGLALQHRGPAGL
jgi:hypothetical protein